jgi:DNA-binding protein HU-beta
MARLTKQHLVDEIAAKADITKKQAGNALNALLETIQNSLAQGDSVSLIGFGTFEVRNRAARDGRNPQTGEPIRIPAKRVPAFKAGKTLKDAVE